MEHFVVISGCSGGGKSTLLAELSRRGHNTVPEPGRRIVAEEIKNAGAALPWLDMAAFAHRAIDVALADLESAKAFSGWVFFDRGLVDAVVGLKQATGDRIGLQLAQEHRYHRRVFLAPPWPEIYVMDAERRHNESTAVAEYLRLLDAYPSLGYEVCILPKVGVAERADFVLRNLEE